MSTPKGRRLTFKPYVTCDERGNATARWTTGAVVFSRTFSAREGGERAAAAFVRNAAQRHLHEGAVMASRRRPE